MRIPNFEQIKEQKLTPKSEERSYCSRCSTSFNPNPKLYKYYWWVFWAGSPCDGREFLSPQYRMTTKKAFDFMEELSLKKEPHWLYNRLTPRDDPQNPFDKASDRWRGVEWAVAFDEDTDEIYNGHK
jgi:hypothetical protein